MGQGESTTDAHPAKHQRKPAHPAWQITLASAIATVLVGGGGAAIRSKDVDRIESRQAQMEAQSKINTESIIELRAEAKADRTTLERIDRNVESLRASVDAMRDRLPR